MRSLGRTIRGVRRGALRDVKIYMKRENGPEGNFASARNTRNDSVGEKLHYFS
jgi:hypothetical protein